MSGPGRRPLQLGEVGEVFLTPRRKVDGRWVKVDPRQAQMWEARVYFRGHDGVRRDVQATARRRGEAEAAVLTRAAERLRGTGDHELRPGMPLVDAGQWFLREISREDSSLSRRTITDYTATWGRYVPVSGSLVAGLTLEQANDPQRLLGFLRAVADQHGTGASKMMRSTMSGLLNRSVELGVLPTNALLQVRAVRSNKPKHSPYDRKRAFTRAERDAVITYADDHVPDPEARLNPRTQRLAQSTADLAAFMAGTGVRIEEARSTCWPEIDLESRTVFIDGTKSDRASRALNLPDWLHARLQRRAEAVSSAGGVNDGYVFASPSRDDPWVMWDQSNSAKAMRRLLDGAGFPWAVPHTFRRTVASLLHEGGAPIARIADQLGHKDPSVTARVYLGRDLEGDKADLASLL